MINYLRKYHTKIIFCLSLIILLIAAAITISGNIFLNKSKDTIIRAISAKQSQKTFIKSIIYLPPNFIFVSGASFGEPGPFLVIPQTLIRFSLYRLIIKRRFFLTGASFYNPRGNYHKLYELVKNNFQALIDFIKLLPKQDIKLKLKGLELELGRQQDGAGYIRADFLLKIKGNSLSGSGLINKETVHLLTPGAFTPRGAQRPFSITEGLPLRYNFRGYLQGDGFSLENLELMRQNFYAQLWGGLSGSIFQMNGFVFANSAFQEPVYPVAVFGIPKQRRFFVRRPRALSSAIDLSLVNLYLLDIDCQLNLRLPDIQIEHLRFLLNNNPMSIKGKVNLADKVLLDLMLSFGPAKLERQVSENLKKINLAIKATLKDMVFNGSGLLHFDFIKKKKASPPLDKLQFDFQDLGLYFDRYPRIRMSLGKLDLSCSTESNKYRVLLEDVGAVLHLQHDRFKYIEFGSRFYDGFLKGQARMDIASPYPKISSSIRVKAVTANKLEDVLIHFSKVYGKLDGRMFLSTYPVLGLSGRMSIRDGRLQNFEFFKWLADFFALASLKRIDFSRASSAFAVTEDGAGLYGMSLDSQDVDLNGYFKLGLNDFVSSKMSLALTKPLLAESPKFTRLLKLVSPDLDALTFKFQLSGILDRMNFKWLRSDLKRELQERIPNFIERKIERDVQAAIEDVSPSDLTLPP